MTKLVGLFFISSPQPEMWVLTATFPVSALIRT